MNIEDIKDKKIAVHCKTHEQSRYLCNHLYELKMYFTTFKSALNNSYWYHFMENSCYSIERKRIFVDDITWAKENNYTIIEYEEFENENH